MSKFTYVLDGHEPRQETDIVAWGRWFDAATQERMVGHTQVVGADNQIFLVSTVFTGIDNNYGERGVPWVFETMVFSQGDEAPDFPIMRYADWETATKGHQKMIEMVEAKK